MSGNDDFRVRPGKIRSTRGPRTKPFLAQALQAAQKAGGLSRGSGSRSSRFGRGRAASLAASRMLQARGRGAMVKARVVRQMRSPGALRAHIGYLKRDGVTRDGSPGKLFDAAGDDADGRAFAERCEEDRHHFRFIVSPDDAGELSSLRSLTRELMDQASRDLGTRLDWVAVDHWNTEHPHVHILVRGRADDGADLVISRDYIGTGLRARAGDLVTRELGPKSELEVRRSLEAEVTAERWTKLDRAIAREAGRAEGVIDLRPERDAAGDPLREIRIGRMRTLERLGFAEPAGSARWVLAPDAEQRLRALGNVATSSSGCIRRSRRTEHLAQHPPGRSKARPTANRSSAVSLPAALTMNCGARRLPSLMESTGASITSSFPTSTWPVTVPSAALWNCVVLTMRGVGSASR
jgi:type IV secretory pathway VirD2 relaxase